MLQAEGSVVLETNEEIPLGVSGRSRRSLCTDTGATRDAVHYHHRPLVRLTKLAVPSYLGFEAHVYRRTQSHQSKIGSSPSSRSVSIRSRQVLGARLKPQRFASWGSAFSNALRLGRNGQDRNHYTIGVIRKVPGGGR